MTKLYQKRSIVCYLFFVFYFLTFGNGCCTTISVYPRYTDVVLKNPAMGLVLPVWINTLYKKCWYTELCKVGYTRWTWADLEPRRRAYHFYKIQRFSTICKNFGLTPAFRIMTTITNGTATPKYVFKDGVAAFPHKNGKQLDPVYWDSTYLTAFGEFIDALGQYTNGGEGFEFIDIGGIGVWGEMHLGLHMHDMWSTKQLEKANFSYERFKNAYIKLINMYKKAFPKTQLILNISRYDEIAQYAAENGIGLRFDGLTSSLKGTLKHICSVFNEYGMGKYTREPVPCIFEFASKYLTINDIKGALNIALTCPVSYLHLNICDLDDLDKEGQETIVRISKKVGYRLRLEKIVLTFPPSTSGLAKWEMKITSYWNNYGIAPPTKRYRVGFELNAIDGQLESRKIVYPIPPTTSWTPNDVIVLESELRVRQTLRPGKYILKVFMNAEDNPCCKINLPLEGSDGRGAYNLCLIDVSNGSLSVSGI